MAVPKRRTSKARRNKRNAHRSLSVPSFSNCRKCNEPSLPHRVCPSCGYYRDRLVIEQEEE